MLPNEYQSLALRTMADQDRIRQRLHTLGYKATQLDNGARGLAGDCGEISTAVQRYIEYGNALDVANLLEEAGDCLWRLAQILDAVGLTLEQAMHANIAKLSVRYGDKFTDFLAAEENRDRTKERQALEDTIHTLKYTTCGGCGADHPDKRCLGCLHDFHQITDSSIAGPQVSHHASPVPIESAPETTGDALQQTGQGWAEPPLVPEGPIQTTEPPEDTLTPGPDGTRRRELSNSYNRYCNVCKRNPVHVHNSACICPDCAAKLRAQQAELDRRLERH
jgi:NTP pyrophosphatase (non-canonical NTP hydrolase)